MRRSFLAAVALASCQNTSRREGATSTASAQATFTDAGTANTTRHPASSAKIGIMSPMTSKEMIAKVDGIEMKATFHGQKDRVDVEVTVINATQISIYVTDFAFEVKREGVSLRFDRLWVGYMAPETAILASRLFPLDTTVRRAHPPDAYATKVVPNGTYRSTLHASIPLHVEGAQLQVPDVDCARTRFELGVIPDSPELTPIAMTIDGKAVFRLSTAAWRLQKVLAVEADFNVPMITK